MKPLTLTCKIKDRQRLDMSWLSYIKTSELPDIKNTLINYGSKPVSYTHLRAHETQ